MNLSFKGKTILVGGATDGIGWACVKQFSALGANIILLGRNEQKLSQRLEEISVPKIFETFSIIFLFFINVKID